MDNHCRPGHVKEFRDQSLAIDGFAWLHRGAFSCALELATGQATTRYLDYCLHMVEMLKHYGVTPIVVLDGAPLPGKATVNSDRRSKRGEWRTKGQEHMDMGQRMEAESCFQKAISITADMANHLQRSLLEKGVECIVAPFEADAQMAYLVKNGLASGVITEDSDMVPYGIDTVVYKMDRYGACCILDVTSLKGLDPDKPIFNMPASLEKRLDVCILAGCDYLPSVPGIGIAKALALVKHWNTGARAIKELRRLKKAVPDDYEKLFRQAKLTFMCHWVYDPQTCCIVHLNPLPLDSQDFAGELVAPEDFLGNPLSKDVAERVCSKGLLHAATLEPFKEWQPAAKSGGKQGVGGGGGGGVGKAGFSFDNPNPKPSSASFFNTPSSRSKNSGGSSRGGGGDGGGGDGGGSTVLGKRAAPVKSPARPAKAIWSLSFARACVLSVSLCLSA